MNALAAETFFGSGTRAREKATRSLVSVFHNCLTSRDAGEREREREREWDSGGGEEG
jgi:hypothetical protein